MTHFAEHGVNLSKSNDGTQGFDNTWEYLSVMERTLR